MSYQVLALKYRPRIFEDLVGQEAVSRTLTNAIQQNRIAHAFLFAGVRGVGKTTTARILAKALNCSRGPTVRPCGECPACREIARGGSLDVLEIDGASNNGVEQVREIIEASRYAPSRDRFKIYIIDEVHMLTQAAFNALLKTLEEPPPSVKFIFATTEHHKIPDTILSRCQEFEFRTISPVEIASQVRTIADAEGIEISEPAVVAIARAAEGSLRDGISALDQVVAATGGSIEEKDVTELLGLIERDVLRETTRAVVERDTALILKIVDSLVRGGRDLRYFTSAWISYLRDVMVVRVAPQAGELVELPGETRELEALAKELTEEDLLRALDILTEVESGLRTSPEPRFHLEMALLKISQLRRLASFEELLERFETLGTDTGAPSPSGSPPPSSPGRARASAGSSPGVGSGSAEEGSDQALESASTVNQEWTSEASLDDDGVEVPDEATRTDDGLVGRLVERLKTSKPMLHALVSHYHRAELGADRLTLVFPSKRRVLAEQLQQSELHSLLEEQAAAVAGRRLTIAVEISDNGDEEETPAQEPAPARSSPVAGAPGRDELNRRAQEDPLVRRFVDAFQGEIEDVRSRDE